LVSAVLYDNAHLVPDLGHVLEACRRAGAELLVDAYHALNVVPFSLRTAGLGAAFVVGGGYKYCQLGEGNCFLRVPASCALRPVITGGSVSLRCCPRRLSGVRSHTAPAPIDSPVRPTTPPATTGGQRCSSSSSGTTSRRRCCAR